MAKKTVIVTGDEAVGVVDMNPATPEIETEVEVISIPVYTQLGEFVKEFDNIPEAYAFAGENGYRV